MQAQGATAIDDVEVALFAKMNGNGQKVTDYHLKAMPRNHDLQASFTRRETPRNITTVMLRNIPNRLCHEELIAELEELGFSGTFDFVYIPMDNGRKQRGSSRSSISNVGYAFVNFLCASWAERCTAVFRDHSFPGSNRVTRVSPAHVQGLEANMAHFAALQGEIKNSSSGNLWSWPVPPIPAVSFRRHRGKRILGGSGHDNDCAR